MRVVVLGLRRCGLDLGHDLQTCACHGGRDGHRVEKLLCRCRIAHIFQNIFFRGNQFIRLAQIGGTAITQNLTRHRADEGREGIGAQPAQCLASVVALKELVGREVEPALRWNWDSPVFRL